MRKTSLLSVVGSCARGHERHPMHRVIASAFLESRGSANRGLWHKSSANVCLLSRHGQAAFCVVIGAVMRLLHESLRASLAANTLTAAKDQDQRILYAVITCFIVFQRIINFIVLFPILSHPGSNNLTSNQFLKVIRPDCVDPPYCKH
ncbi:hypothetical protein GOBAR_AA26297 [Gossypium barbadense]|uniref:Uncharacterized protein n=1 Tax=Gossypium barbadense TaxID=3634 RepID=A0A2P5WTF5_GOSBA|nr:hypothetical protein GOBAR_AA26297 [Gossypium barbadense]